ncbi:MAG: MlaD family protein [Paramuribaculum sp.]|nr:MlaD family protein [Paramuribaculum sp.]
MKKRFSKEWAIGLSVLVALFIMVFGINYLKGINIFKAANYYYASYTDVAGLTQSAPVTVNGFQVGLVKSIEYEYDNPGHVLVELSLDKHLRVPQGTEAVISVDMLGTASVVLRMSDSKDYYSVGDKLVAVTDGGLMENVSQNIMPAISSLFPKLDSILTAAANLASDPALAQSVKRLDAITANLETSTRLLSKTMVPMPRITGSAATTISRVDSIAANLEALSAELNNLPLNATLDNVNQVTSTLASMLKSMESDESTLGLLMHDRRLYENLNATVSSMDSLLIDIKKNPKRYISIKLL